MALLNFNICKKDGSKFRVGIIGTGGIAHSHMRAYASFPGIDMVALCDIIPGKAQAFANEFGLTEAHTYEDYKEMIDKENLDAISVCTYNCQHKEPTIYALHHGVNVLLEKPFSVTLEESIEMVKAERESGKMLTIGFQPRFDKNMRFIKKIVDSGELGKVYYIQTGGGRRRGIPANDSKTTFIEKGTAGIGALADIGCYSLDMVLNAIGYPKPLTVSGFKTDYFGKNPKTYFEAKNPQMIADKFGVDDFAGGFIRLEGGIFLDFRISWAMNMNTTGDTLILGTEGGLRIPSTECWNGTVGGPMVIYRHVAGQPTEEVMPVLKTDEAKEGTLWQRKIYYFMDAILKGKPAPVPSSEIIINQAIIDGLVRSADCGHEVEVNIPEF